MNVIYELVLYMVILSPLVLIPWVFYHFLKNKITLIRFIILIILYLLLDFFILVWLIKFLNEIDANCFNGIDYNYCKYLTIWHFFNRIDALTIFYLLYLVLNSLTFMRIKLVKGNKK